MGLGTSMSTLFAPLTLRGLVVPNRVWLAPMCQYSAVDGHVTDWHLVHLGARAAGGFGLLLAEATAVVPEGRITPQDAGLWHDAHVDSWRRVTDFVHARGARIGVQLAHAGRKASTYRGFPGEPTGAVPLAEGGWTTVGAGVEPFPGLPAPGELATEQVAALPGVFAAAARRAIEAGFDTVEVHAAHGYLLHQLLSPLTNQRDDVYGGSPENRMRALVEVVAAVRAVLPAVAPLLVRVSATDWTEGGLTVADVAAVTATLAEHGVDLVDVSTGGLVPADIPVGPGYQVPAAREVRAVSGLPVGAVGLLTDARQAEALLDAGDADVVLLGRVALRDPSWPLRAAHELGADVPAHQVLAGAADVLVGAAPVTGWQAQYARGTWA